MLKRIFSRPAVLIFAVLMLILTGIITLHSCASPNHPLIIATDTPEVLDYLEYMRSSGEAPPFTSVFSEQVDRDVALGGIQPDIIISSDIAHPEFGEYLYSIPMYRLRGSEGKDGFSLDDLYEGSYSPFIKDNSVRVLPLAFDLPLVYLNRDFAANIDPDQIIDYPKLLSSAMEYTRSSRDNYSSMGFSSMRDMRFIEMLISEMTGVRSAIPPKKDLDAAMNKLKPLLEDYQQDPTGQLYYNDIFAYAPDHAELSEGRLFSALGSFNAYSNDDDTPLKNFPFVWISSDKGVEALSPMLYAGISRGSSRKPASVRFIRDMLSSRMQANYLAGQDALGIRVSAFLNRASSNRIINGNILPELNNGLRLPDEDHLVFPGEPLQFWDRVRVEIYDPWLKDWLTGQDVSVDDLYADLDAFYKLEGRYQ